MRVRRGTQTKKWKSREIISRRALPDEGREWGRAKTLWQLHLLRRPPALDDENNVPYFFVAWARSMRFGKVKIAVYPDDHGVPHVHVIGPGFKCSLDVETLELLPGTCLPRH
jgi:hypothetical protein